MIEERTTVPSIRHRRAIWRWALVAACLIVALPVLLLLLFPINVQRGFSMSPTINDGDYFLVSNISYLNSAPLRGDVVTFKQLNGLQVGRIVGIAGDHIQMREGKLYINGVVGDLKYEGEVWAGCQGYECPTHAYEETLPGIPSHSIVPPGAFGPMGNTVEFIVPRGAYFVLYDNRETGGNSSFSDIPDTGGDSRFSGFVLKPSITSRAISKVFDGRTQSCEWVPV